MPRKLKPLTKAQLEVVDVVALLSLAGRIEESSEHMKGYKKHLINDLSPKQKQIYSAIQRRAKRVSKEYVEWLEKERNEKQQDCCNERK